MYELLKRQEDGALFGHDKLSFIIDQNLNQLVVWLQSQASPSPCAEIALKVLVQLGRVRSNPADYLAAVVARQDGKVIQLDLSADIEHIGRDLHLTQAKETQPAADAKDDSKPKESKRKFTEQLSLNRGILYYYKAGDHKLDVTSQDQLVTDGRVLYHLKRGKGLYMLGIGDGTTKMSGIIKKVNQSEAVKSMEPSAMFLLDGKLYIRDYCSLPSPFLVYDAETLQPD